eukprot:598523-Rhodomonas_salina.2
MDRGSRLSQTTSCLYLGIDTSYTKVVASHRSPRRYSRRHPCRYCGSLAGTLAGTFVGVFVGTLPLRRRPPWPSWPPPPPPSPPSSPARSRWPVAAAGL